MRKVFLAVLAGVVLVLAFALPAQAAYVGKYLGQADFNFRGQYWMWGSTQENTADYDSGVHDRRQSVYQRFRLYFDSSYKDRLRRHHRVRVDPGSGFRLRSLV